MSRRGPYTTNLRCAEPGCRETSFYESDTLRERAESAKYYERNPYRCYRHTRSDEILSVESPVKVGVLIATRVKSNARSIYDKSDEDRYLPGLYWHTADGKGGSGRESGPGFKAIASDLPEGTRLIVTARLELPDEIVSEWKPGDIVLDRTDFVWRRFDQGWMTFPRSRGVQYGDTWLVQGLGPLTRLDRVPPEVDDRLGCVMPEVARVLREKAGEVPA